MEALNRTRRITIGMVVFVVVIIVGLLTFKKPMYSYQLSASDMMKQMATIQQITPDKAVQELKSSSAVFVDIRNIYDFEKDHLDKAINLPLPDLLSKESKKMFDQWKKDGTQVILYGNDEREATTPWMLLYELGYTNTRILSGGYNYLNGLLKGDLTADVAFDAEQPDYDFSAISDMSRQNQGETDDNVKAKTVILRKKKKKAAEGGC